MRQKVTFMLLAMLFCCVLGIHAQTGGQVSGKVVDAMGELPGVSVVVKGTTNGTTTDLEGKFTLGNVKPSDILQFSFIGYKTQDIKVGDQRTFNITLEEDAQALDEVVVVGYQEVRKKDLTGSVSKVNMSDLLKTPSASFDQTLGGRIAGVNVSSGEGMPGGTMTITIRGNNSLTQDNTPLYIIDGFPVEDARVAAAINPSDIESTDVLKDASATAIYGARGANGVIIITTKQGKVGKPQLSYDGSFGISTVTKKLDMMDAYDYVKLQLEVDPTRAIEKYLPLYEGHQWTLDDYRGIAQNNYQDEIFRTAWQQNHNVRLSGGSEGIRYNASLSYYDQDGILLNSNYERLQSRLNTLVKRGKLTINFNSNFSRSIQSGSSPSSSSYSGMNNLFYSVWGYRPVNYPGKSLDSLLNDLVDDDVDASNDYRFNPIADLKNAYRKYYVNNLQLNGYVEYEFIKGLKLKVSGGWTYDNRHTDTFNDSKTRYGGPTSTDKVNAEVVRQQRLTWLNENILTYQTNFKSKHFLNALLGVTLQNSDYEYYSLRMKQIPNESLGMAGMSQGTFDKSTSTLSSWSMLSYLGRVNYNYKSKYYATASFRADGSSKFGPDKRWGYFPSGALAWIISEENFLKNYSHIVSYLKLRASIGKTGSQNLGNYDWRTLMGSATYNDAPGIKPSSLGNDILQWESQVQKEIGLDYGFWDDRIRGSIGYYQKKVDNLLYSDPVPYSSSFSSVTQNIGSLKNKGFEFDVKVDIIKNTQKDLTWDFDFNVARNITTLEKLNSEDEYFGGGAYQYFKIDVGGKTGILYGYKYGGRLIRTNEELVALKTINPETGQQQYYRDENNYERPGDLYIMDLDGDGQITADGDRTEIGNANPDFFGGFGTTLYWKGLMVNATFTYSVGADRFYDEEKSSAGDMNVYNTSKNTLKSWTMNPGVDRGYPRAMYYGWGSNSIITNRYVHDASFLRLSALNISYRLPKRLFGSSIVDAIDLTFQATNLFTWTKYPGMDPQGNFSTSYSAFYNMGIDYSSYPSARTYNVGIKITLK